MANLPGNPPNPGQFIGTDQFNDLLEAYEMLYGLMQSGESQRPQGEAPSAIAAPSTAPAEIQKVFGVQEGVNFAQGILNELQWKYPLHRIQYVLMDIEGWLG